MKVVLVEDEFLALRNLQIILDEISSIHVIATLDSISETVEWFNTHPQPDLLFLDIHLADGSAFDIFDRIQINCPIIFTTAYDEYALQAFKVNSVDYLLKPIDKTDVKRAIDKLKLLQSSGLSIIDYAGILKTIQPPPKKFKDRFIIKIGDTIRSLSIGEIAYFYTENKANFVCTNDGKRYPVDFNLDQAEQMLNPKNFFRINRQFIIGHHAIEEMKAHTRSRIIIKLKPACKLETVVAIDRAIDFRSWLSE